MYYAPPDYKCRCINRDRYVDVDEVNRKATFYCDLCIRGMVPEPEIRAVTWLGSCPPYTPFPPQIRISFLNRLNN